MGKELELQDKIENLQKDNYNRAIEIMNYKKICADLEKENKILENEVLFGENYQ